MAKTKQFTVSIDNHPGAVAEIVRTLGSAKVNILSLLGTSQGTGGIVQLLVDDPRRAKKALDSARVAYQETLAELHELPNKPGALALVLDKLAAKGINLASIHATARKAARRPSSSTLPKRPRWQPLRLRRSLVLHAVLRPHAVVCSPQQARNEIRQSS